MRTMKTIPLLLLLVLVASTMTACGQRVAPKPPADRVYDSMSY
jgi:predicted small lipoprotein YifL